MLYGNRLVRGLALMALLAGILAGPAGRFLLTARAGGALTRAAVIPAPVAGPALVVINEIAWAGTAASADDEWIELFNRSYYPVNLAGWSLRARDGEPDIRLSGTIPARGFFLLERGDDATISNLRANQVYAGAISDVGEMLSLYDGSRNLVDHANAFHNTWLAGDLTRQRSMERTNFYADRITNWATHNGLVMNGLDAGGRPIHGTPKRRNSGIFAAPTPTYTPFPGDLPDLKIAWMKFEFQYVNCGPPTGNPLGLKLLVENIGLADAGSFQVSVETLQRSWEHTVPGMAAGERAIVFFPYLYIGPPEVKAMVDSSGLIRESNEDNNFRIQMIPIYTFTPPAPCTTATPTPTRALPGGSAAPK